MATINWLGGDGDWSTAANWSSGVVPGSADEVTIGATDPSTVTITTAEAARALTLSTDVTLDIGNFGQGDGTLRVGGDLTMNDGASVAVGAHDAAGTLSVGGNLTLDDAGMTIAGDQGALALAGNLILSGSSEMALGGYEATGVATVGGNLTLNGSALLEIGDGTLVLDGGLILNMGMLRLEGTLAADGAVDVRGGNFTVSSGALDLGGVLRVTGGAFDLDGGTINGGVVSAAGGAVEWKQGTLNGVTCYGPMVVSGSLLIAGAGLIAKGVGGRGPGIINLTGGTLAFQNTQTIGDATITITAAGGSLGQYDTNGAQDSLTLGASLIVDVHGKGSIAGDNVVNQGAINVLPRGDLSQTGTEFVNEGTVTVVGGASIELQATNFVNTAGAVIIGKNNSRITIGDSGGSWSNAGTITATDSVVIFDSIWSSNSGVITIDKSTVVLEGRLTTAQLSLFENRGDSITLGGTLNNSGAVLAIDPGSGLDTMIVTGAITGGTITGDSSNVLWEGVLDGVTYDGTLDISRSEGSGVLITDKGLIVNGANGTGPGVVDVLDEQALSFEGTQTFDNATINIGGGSAILAYDPHGAVTILTLGANLTIDQTGPTAYLSTAYAYRQNRQDGIVNLGTINASGGTFIIDPLNFTNLGTITITNGATVDLSIGQTQLTNLARGVLTGGLYEVEAGSTVQLGKNLRVTSDNAVIILSGAGSVIESLDTETGDQVSIDSTLTSITAKGVLEILDGRDFTSTNTIDNLGRLALGGGTFTTGTLTDATGSVLSGRGVVASTLYDHGDVVSSGVLSFTGRGDRFYGALSGGQIAFAGGSDTLLTGSSLAAGIVGVATGAVVYLRCDQSFAGSWRQSGGLVFLGGFDLSLSGAGSVAGVIGGDGALNFAGGRESLLAGARLAITSWSIAGDTTVNVEENLHYEGIFSATSSTIAIFSGDTLSFTGAATFAGGVTVAGDGSLALAQATFNGDNVIGAVTVDTGLIDVGSGNLEFKRAIDGKGILELGDGVVVEVDAAASATLTTDFAGAGATLALGAAKNFLSAISGFAAGDTIDLIDTVATGAMLETGDKLVIVDGSKAIATLSLNGDYAGDTFNVSSDGHGGSDITLATQSMNCDIPNVALFAQQMSALAPQGATTQALSAVAHVVAPAHLTAPKFQP